MCRKQCIENSVFCMGEFYNGKYLTFYFNECRNKGEIWCISDKMINKNINLRIHCRLIYTPHLLSVEKNINWPLWKLLKIGYLSNFTNVFSDLCPCIYMYILYTGGIILFYRKLCTTIFESTGNTINSSAQ